MELETVIDIFDNLKDEDKKTVLTDLRNIVLKNLKIKNHYLATIRINKGIGSLETIFQNTNNKDYMSIHMWSEFDCFYDDIDKNDPDYQDNQIIYCFELALYKDDKLVSDKILSYTSDFEQSLNQLRNFIDNLLFN